MPVTPLVMKSKRLLARLGRRHGKAQVNSRCLRHFCGSRLDSGVCNHNSGTTNVNGEPFLVDQGGSVEKVKRWVGVLNSPDGWRTEERYSEDYIRKELIYGGRSGSTIEVSYREFRGGLAAPAFSQNVKYDLATSRVIRFQRFQIDIQKADNQSITYLILSD